MDVQVTGRNIDIGDSFRQYITDRLNNATDKLFSRSIDSSVTISKQGHLYHVECSLHANQGVKFQGHAEAGDIHAAFDKTAEKVEKQLRRYKRRIKNHHHSDGKASEKLADLMMAETDND